MQILNDQLTQVVGKPAQMAGPDATTKAVQTPLGGSLRKDAFGSASIDALRAAAQVFFVDRFGQQEKPKVQELRAFIFQYLAQVYRVIEKRDAFSLHADMILSATDAFERGEDVSCLRVAWIKSIQEGVTSVDPSLDSVSWLLALQAGILDRNLKRILEEMAQSGKIGPDQLALAEGVRFFDPDCALPQTLELWTTIIQLEFPLTVFTLDPQVEEQNVYDAFSRRREMQVALAYGVATGELNADKAMSFSRQLALDMETISLNRTVVGFSHAQDTFGWYFYPRIQTPPTESTNIGAFARTIWSTGPTEHYDNKHRNLEPGIRECEVIVAMPSFVTKVSFDVTTNWELLTNPGKTKRSYEEMVAQGGRLHRLRSTLDTVQERGCYRPGDYGRLISRIEQLEHLLGMQTYVVNVPYQYEQSGTDIFDSGDIRLAPVVQDFYGLSYLKADADINARFFVRGKNFHPTLTHVVVGGTESHSLNATAKIEVISRELLLVQTDKLQSALSPSTFEVRVGTPAGLSNPIRIPSPPSPPAAPPPAPSSIDWSKKPLAYEAEIRYDAAANPRVSFIIEDQGTQLDYRMNTPLPVDLTKTEMVFLVSGSDSQGKQLFSDVPSQLHSVRDRPIPLSTLGSEIERILNHDSLVSTSRIPAEIRVKTVVKFDNWPFETFDTLIKFKVNQKKP